MEYKQEYERENATVQPRDMVLLVWHKYYRGLTTFPVMILEK